MGSLVGVLSRTLGDDRQRRGWNDAGDISEADPKMMHGSHVKANDRTSHRAGCVLFQTDTNIFMKAKNK